MNKIKLRAIEPEDLDFLYTIENDIHLWNVGTTNVPYSRYTLHDYIATSSDDIYADKQLRLIIEDENKTTIGIADIMNFSPQHMRAETGIVIIDSERRKGYAEKALNALCDYSLRILHLHQLYGIIAVDNNAAIRLYEKSGFVPQLRLIEWLYDGKNYKDAMMLQRFL